MEYKKYSTIFLLGVFSAIIMVVFDFPLSFHARIHSVPSAFLEMSPDIKNLIDQYNRDECEYYQGHECDEDKLKEELSVLIAKEWPHVYDKISVYQNWGNARLTKPNRDQFFLETKGFTPSKFRNEWLPVIRYTESFGLVLAPCSETDRRRYVPRKVIQAGLCK